MNRSRGSADLVTMARAFAHPGIDDRTWVSYGQVTDHDDGDAAGSPVHFDEDLGCPLVAVKLQPSGKVVACRASSGMAGRGEGSWHPFVRGDEVIVVVPEGMEASGPVIVGRLNNEIDPFPFESVAGQDPRRNTFAFERRRTPLVQEHASSWMVRVASHGGFLLISDTGAVTIRDGSKGALQLGPDAFSFVEGQREVGSEDEPSPQALVQLDLTGRRASLQMDDALVQLNSSDADANAGQCFIVSPAQLTVQCGTNQPLESVLTVEAFLALLEVFATALLPPAGGAAAITALQAAVALGGSALSPLSATALATGKGVQALTAKGPAGPQGVQLAPGLGAILFQTG